MSASVPGGLIEAVAPGSVAASAGLQPGDRLLAINGQPLRDVIDVQFYGADESLALSIERGGTRREVVAERGYEQDLGLSFTNPTFDVDIRRCANRCEFCFVKGNPPSGLLRLRRSLYIKDDDYRYSFLFGNFVTLTNLTGEDWARLEEQRLSPLYVSVHATEPELRRRLLGHTRSRGPGTPDILQQLQRLSELGIEVHTQVVLVPGQNDGPHLDRTLADLMALAGGPVASVGVVPVGLTRYHRSACRTYTAQESLSVLDQVVPWQEQGRQRWDVGFVYPSDEWYLVADKEVPPAEAYDDFPQVENGVGMVRQLLDEWDGLKARWGKHHTVTGRRQGVRGTGLRPPRPATLVCGTLIAPVLAAIVDELNELTGAGWCLLPVVNQLFGEMTTVSGLLTGQDVLAALHGRELGERVLLPRAMFTGRYGAGSAPPGTTLDDLHISDMAARLDVPVSMAGSLTEALSSASV
jgi:putative radical SAM enzyme (TIGR03279 family)